MSGPCLTTYPGHQSQHGFLEEQSRSVSDSYRPYRKDPSRRWGVLVEPDSDSETAEAASGGSSKPWQHWGKGWRHFVADTFHSGNKRLPRLPSRSPSPALSRASRNGVAERKPSLTRSNAVHRRSRYPSSALSVPSPSGDDPYEQLDPASPTPSMTSGESTTDTPVDSPTAGGAGASRCSGSPRQYSDVLAFDEMYFHQFPDVVATVPRSTSPAPIIVVEKLRIPTPVAKDADGSTAAAPDRSVEELQERIRRLEEELRQKNDDLAKKDNELAKKKVLVQDILDKLRPADQEEAVWEDCSEPLAEAERIGSRITEANSFLRSIDGALTPRNLLMLKYVQRRGDSVGGGTNLADNSTSTSTSTMAIDTRQASGIDSAMTLAEAAEFAALLDMRRTLGASGTLSVKFCRVCRIPKFLNAPLPPETLASSPFAAEAASGASEINEFFSRTGVTACCAKAICKSCYVSGLVAGTATDWWHNLGAQDSPADGSLGWLRCPMSTCTQAVPQPSTQEQERHGLHSALGVRIAARLWTLGGNDLTMHAFRFERASKLRAALEALTPRPTAEALTLAARMHEELVRRGRMRDMFSTGVNVNDMGLQMLPVDTEDGSRSLRVPIFTGLLISPTTARESLVPAAAVVVVGGGPVAHTTRECSICCDTVRDVTDGTPGDEGHWAAVVAAFPGAWSVAVRGFPSAAVLPACASRHALDVCRGCLARHMSSQLESRGREVAGRLACPNTDCGHVYSHDEVRSVLQSSSAAGDDDLFARYDRLCLLNHLSGIEGFMWCLREGCDSGQIYDIVPAMDDLDNGRGATSWATSRRHKVSCESCGFDMCHRHQSPWHQGLSCREWDELAADNNGSSSPSDPAEAASRRWLAANTKRCPGPGCGVAVQKGEGCFHMTCRRCSFEFCWECLADWNDVVPSSRRRNNNNNNGGPAVPVLVGDGQRYDPRGHNVGCFFRDPAAPQPTALRGTSAREAARRAGQAA